MAGASAILSDLIALRVPRANPETPTHYGLLFDGGGTPTGVQGPGGVFLFSGLPSGVGSKVRAASIANLNLASMPAAVDGAALTLSVDTFLAKNQTAPEQNGVYLFNGAGAAATRAVGYAAFNAIAGASLTVLEGTANADTYWLCTANQGGTLDTSALPFRETDFSAGAVLATLLGGLSIATTTEPDSTASILVALGRLIGKVWHAMVASDIANIATRQLNATGPLTVLDASRPWVDMNNAAAVSGQIDGTLAYSKGDVHELRQMGAGVATFTISGGSSVINTPAGSVTVTAGVGTSVRVRCIDPTPSAQVWEYV